MRCPVTLPTTLLRAMPIYEYRCENGHTFEVIQSMSDDPVETCEVCGAPVERVFHPVAVHFKGSGFYSTDYGGKAKSGSSKESDSSSSDAKSSNGSDKTTTKSDSGSSSSSD
jgi:putative FmdB family regulatory protein